MRNNFLKNVISLPRFVNTYFRVYYTEYFQIILEVCEKKNTLFDRNMFITYIYGACALAYLYILY